MKLNYFVTADHEAMSKQTAELIIKTLQKKTTGLYCFAGGDTPVRTLELLVEAHQQKKIDLSQAFYIELDEWVGLDPADSGSCRAYLERHLWEPAGVPVSQRHVFDPLADDLSVECQKADSFIIEHGGLTLSLLGVGVNGHLGFNEPGTSFASDSHVIDLDAVTQTVGQKYFTGDVKRDQGITLGIGQLLASEELLVIASGATKKDAIKTVLSGDVTEDWPVTSIWKHNNPHLIVDRSVVN